MSLRYISYSDFREFAGFCQWVWRRRVVRPAQPSCRSFSQRFAVCETKRNTRQHKWFPAEKNFICDFCVDLIILFFYYTKMLHKIFLRLSLKIKISVQSHEVWMNTSLVHVWNCTISKCNHFSILQTKFIHGNIIIPL